MSVAIDAFLEGLDADPVHHVDEALGFAVAALEVAGDELLDPLRNVGACERGPDNLPQRRARSSAGLALVSADLDLVPLLAVLVDAEDADVSDVVVAAGVHAARDVEVELADVVKVIEVVEALLDGLGHRDRLGVGERAEVAARAGDDVGEQPDVGRGEAELARLAPERGQVRFSHVGENQVLLVRDAQLAERIAIGEIGDRLHLLACHVARRNAGLLEGERDGGVPGHLVSMHVAPFPALETGPAERLDRRQAFVARTGEARFDAPHVFLGQRSRAVLASGPLGFDFLAELVGAALLDQDLDARLPDVVAPAVAVVDAQDRLEVREQMRPGQKLPYDLAEDRGAPEPPADDHPEADLPGFVRSEEHTSELHSRGLTSYAV